MAKDCRKFYAFFLPLRRKDGSNGRAKMPGIDFIQRERPAERGVKCAGVGAAAGANGF